MNKAPWKVEIRDGLVNGTDFSYTPEAFIKDAEGKFVASVNLTSVGYSGTADDRKEDEAKALLLASLPDMFTTMKDLLEFYMLKLEMGDTYCEHCNTHARKHTDNIRGDWNGKIDPIVHKPDCVIGKAEALIKQANCDG